MTPSRRDPDITESGATLIFLPWSGGRDAAETLRGLLETTPASMPVFVPDTPEGIACHEQVPEAQRSRVALVQVTGGGGTGAHLHGIAQGQPDTDVIVIADGVTLPPGWLTKLRAAATVDDAVAAATALASGPGDPLLGEPEAVSGRAAEGEALHPRVLWPWAHCAWIRRSALQLVGAFNPGLMHPAAVLADFGARAAGHSLTCAVADDLFLERTEDRLNPCPEAERHRLAAEHPWLAAAAQDQAALGPGPLRRSVIGARSARSVLSVTVDVRVLGQGTAGTQAYTASLVAALARSSELAVRALVAFDVPAEVREMLTATDVDVVTDREAVRAPRTDVVHRPQQVFSHEDVRLLQAVGDRIIVSQMDLILYRNPAYHASVQRWQAFRQATRMALAVADGTLFFSEHARRDALAEELVEPARTSVVGIGVAPAAGDSPERRPEAVPADRELLLVLGTDYRHKNRPFALALADELARRHGWDGLLVLAGTHQSHGSSADAERELLRARPALAARVIDLGPVPEAEKRWLVAHAQAQICASNYEGFGLIPLEAAAAGRPCIYAPCTSLGEIIDPGAATIVPWDVAASADAAAPLLRAGEARNRHVDLLAQALDRYSWDEVVKRLIESYRRAIASPYRGAAPLAWEAITEESARRALQERVAYGQLLIDGQGGLLTRAQQRGLMRVASRPWLRAPLLAPFGWIGADQRERK